MHAQRSRSRSYSASDASISDNAQGLSRDHRYVEGLPYPSDLIANHPPKVLSEVKNRGQSELPKGWAENTTSVGEDNVAFDQFGEKHLFQAGRTGMDPSHAARHQKHVSEKRKRTRPIQNNLGVECGVGELACPISDHDRSRVAQLGKKWNVLIAGRSQNEDRIIVHEFVSRSYQIGALSTCSFGANICGRTSILRCRFYRSSRLLLLCFHRRGNQVF